MHLDKIANGAESQVLQHCERTQTYHSNTNINFKKTYLNYNLTDDDRTSMQRFKDRIAQCKYRKQKNNVRLESIVLTAPKNIIAEDTVLFFKTAHKALQELTGGIENEVCAWVHRDEVSEHIHYMFVPAVEVKGVLKLSAKTLMNRDKLRILHPTVQQAIDKEFGHHKYVIVADDIRDRQQTSDTIKAYKAKQEKLSALEKETKQAQAGFKLISQQQDESIASLSLLYQQKADADKKLQDIKDRIESKYSILDFAREQTKKEVQKKDKIQKEYDTLKKEMTDLQSKSFWLKQEITEQNQLMAKNARIIKKQQNKIIYFEDNWQDTDIALYVAATVQSEYKDYYDGIVADFWKEQQENELQINIEELEL